MRIRANSIGASSIVFLAFSLLASTAYAQSYGFSVAVDGEHVAGDQLKLSDTVRTDAALSATDIQVRYTGLEIRPSFNVLPVELRSTFRAGEPIKLLVTNNYPAFVSRAEVIIRDADGVVATLPALPNGEVSWTMPADGSGQYEYIARVYDAQNRFDETTPLTLSRTSRLERDPLSNDAIAPGWGEDRTARRSIPLSGGAVTVYGTDVTPGASVSVLGEEVPVDNAGGFVINRILPTGQHDVNIAVAKPEGEVMKFRRSVAIPDSDWFYVALADLTVGARTPSARIEPVNGNQFNETYAKGQLQFYLKGKIRGEYLLTAAGDSGEGPIEDMFRGVLSKNPRSVLARIDPKQFYPVYGDDSELVEDAPTRGKLYVRLERGDSKVMWGTFRTEISNSAFYSDNRVLYGGAATYKSEDVTSNGDAKINVNLHAAYPGTLPQRDVLRGSGGSAYFLHRQDILPSSETIVVEMRDGVSGTVRSRRTLVKGTDYRINYMQGLVILTKPLSSSTQSSAVSSSIADSQYLVVQYEFTPIETDAKNYAFAGAAQTWLTDNISVGATAVREDMTDRTTTLLGANARVQLNESTFISGEVMRSEGQGTSSWVSIDGGLTFVQETIAKRIDPAYAARIAAEADLAVLGLNGTIGASVEGRQAGFAATGSTTRYDQLLVNSFAKLALTPQAELDLRAAVNEQSGYSHTRNYSAELAYQLTPEMTVKAGVTYLDMGTTTRSGARTDLGLGLEYALNDDLEVSAFARKTIMRTGSLDSADRVGVGANYRISDAVTLEGEISYGATGVGGMVGLVHQPTPDERNYIGYRINAADNASLASTARSGVVVGTERKVNEIVSMHSEAIYNTFDRNRTLTQSYGVTLTPDQFWTVNGAFERGNIMNPDGEDLQRTALSLGTGYVSDGVTANVRGELRKESSETGAKDGTSVLITSSTSWRTSDDWRLLASFDGLVSQYNNKALLDGDYVEASLGYAYRPVDNERLNALMRYTFLYDLPGVQQVNASGSTKGPAQRSHIFSIDANYDINEAITIGAKYGVRIGEISETRDPSKFTRSSAHLGIIRVDAEVVKDWNLLLEGRAMVLPEAKTVDLGALAAVYYSFNENVRAGVGYNFAGFSDDLRDLKRDHQGVFFNIMAKY